MKQIDKNVFQIDMTFENTATFETTYSGNEAFSMGYGETTTVTTSDHRELTHRDALNQHPIDAITELGEELDVRPDEYLTNIDIYNIMNS